MRKNLFRLALPFLAGCMVIGSGCNGSGRKGVPTAFATDSIAWNDSLLSGGCRSVVAIAGRYPTQGNQALLDSVRAWIADKLAYCNLFDGTPLFDPGSEPLADGQQLAAITGGKLLDIARTDFAEYMKDSISVTYEQQVRFVPVFESDSLVTYTFSWYGYMGGAHGASSEMAQTFNRNNGAGLTFDNSFIPDSLERLKDLIKEGIWEQYFKPHISEIDWAEAPTLRNTLYIDPDTLPLPVCPPSFRADGVGIVYQQYEIACYAMGMPACVIPYEAVKPLLTSEAGRLIP